MSRMGADGYSSAGTTRLSAKVDKNLKSDFRDACENVGTTMTDAVEEMMADFVADHGGITVGDDDGYYPDDPRKRELYEACLRYADALQLYQRRHAALVAQDTRISKNDLADALMPLRKEGFVALGPMPMDLTGDARKRWRHWRIKPPCADPNQWKYREGK